jgi:hypothetical protein
MLHSLRPLNYGTDFELESLEKERLKKGLQTERPVDNSIFKIGGVYPHPQIQVARPSACAGSTARERALRAPIVAVSEYLAAKTEIFLGHGI